MNKLMISLAAVGTMLIGTAVGAPAASATGYCYQRIENNYTLTTNCRAISDQFGMFQVTAYCPDGKRESAWRPTSEIITMQCHGITKGQISAR
ncbi:MAG: hypothetical protein ABIW49_12025 [Knoellia sp.]